MKNQQLKYTCTIMYVCMSLLTWICEQQIKQKYVDNKNVVPKKKTKRTINNKTYPTNI